MKKDKQAAKEKTGQILQLPAGLYAPKEQKVFERKVWQLIANRTRDNFLYSLAVDNRFDA